MRLVEKRVFNAVNAVPVHIPEPLERGCTELERTAVEHHSPTYLVNAPQAATVWAALVPTQQVPVMIHFSELEFALVSDYKFLIHDPA
jgi:hypothetical protein